MLHPLFPSAMVLASDDQDVADLYKGYSTMCDSNSCEYKFSTALICLAALGDSPTTENLDACCADNGVATACNGQTTYMNQGAYGNGGVCDGGVCIWKEVDNSCTSYAATLDGGGATTAVAGLAIAAAGAAILNVL